MKYVLYILYAIVLVGLSFGVFAVFPIADRAIPYAVLVALVSLAVVTDEITVLLVTALVGGLLQDMRSGFAPGTFMLGYMLVACLLYILQQYVLLATDRIKYLPLLLLAGHIILEIWIVGYSWIGRYMFDSWYIIVHPKDAVVVSVYRLLYHALVLYPIYFSAVAMDNLVSLWYRRLHIR